MAVNFKKLISYSIDNKYEKIYNYLKVNRHLEITKDDIDKIMDLDFDIKIKIRFIRKIKEDIYAVTIKNEVMKYFIIKVNYELLKFEIPKDTLWCYSDFFNFLYREYIHFLKTNDSDIDNLFIASMQLLKKEISKQLTGYYEIDNIVDVIYKIRITELCHSETFNNNDVLDKEIKKLAYIIPSPLLTITNMNYDNKLNDIAKRIIELGVDNGNARDKNGHTFLHNYLKRFGVQNPSNTSQLLEVAVKHGFNVNSEPTLLCNSLNLSMNAFLCVYDMLKEFDYDLINDKSILFNCDEYFSSFCENLEFDRIKDIYLKMVIKFLILHLENDNYKIDPNLGKKICEFDKQLYDALEHLNIYYDEEYLADELFTIIEKNRNESLCVVNEEVDAEEVLYALKELLNDIFNDVNKKFDDVLEAKCLVKKIDSK